MKLFEVKSNVIQQNPRSKSLRTTIPSEIAGILELTTEDQLKWEVSAEDNDIIINIKKG